MVVLLDSTCDFSKLASKLSLSVAIVEMFDSRLQVILTLLFPFLFLVPLVATPGAATGA